MENIKTISNWNRPGGGLGKVIAILVGGSAIVALYAILPFLITLATNTLHLIVLLLLIAAILFLISDKSFRSNFGKLYFFTMRSIASWFIQLDPIKICQKRILDMEKKREEIKLLMGKLKGLIRTNKQDISESKKELEEQILNKDISEKNGKIGHAQLASNKIGRLESLIAKFTKYNEDSEKWFDILSKLDEMADLTIEDTKDKVKIQTKEYQRVKEQHKAFKSIMSIIKGSPDEMLDYNEAMDYMVQDINSKFGEMEYIIDSAGGLMEEYDTKKTLTNKKATNIIERYEKYGINGMFETIKIDTTKAITSDTNGISVTSMLSKPRQIDAEYIHKEETQVTKNKYFDV